MLLVVALVGFAAGVAINALADSLPRSRTLALPTCRSCGASRAGFAWSGLLAFASGSSLCGYCDTPISLRHPIVELLAAAWSAILLLINPAPAVFWPACLLSMIFLLVIVIDFEHRLILHVVTGPAALAMALIGSLDPSLGPLKTLLGGTVGFAAVFGLYLLGGLFARLIWRIRRLPLEEAAFGFGDVTLAGLIGLAVGYPGVLVALVLGILAGGIFSLGYLVAMIARGRYVAFVPIPYSPFLVLGALVVYLGARTGLFA